MSLAHKHEVLDALMTAVDEATALEIIDYRKRMGRRFVLTPRAAGMLARNLAQCPNPVAAADEMMLRGWTAVKPEWLKNQPRQPQRTGIMGAAFNLLENGYGQGSQGHQPALELAPPISRH